MAPKRSKPNAMIHPVKAIQRRDFRKNGLAINRNNHASIMKTPSVMANASGSGSISNLKKCSAKPQERTAPSNNVSSAMNNPLHSLMDLGAVMLLRGLQLFIG